MAEQPISLASDSNASKSKSLELNDAENWNQKGLSLNGHTQKFCDPSIESTKINIRAKKHVS